MPFYTHKGSPFAGALLLAALAPSPAQACTSDAGNVQFEMPGIGIDVATNAVFFVQAPAPIAEDGIELIDFAGLKGVPIEVRWLSPSSANVAPRDELLPDHSYLLRVTTPEFGERTRSFGTGPGPLGIPARLEAPVLDRRVLRFRDDACGEFTAICADAPHPADTTLEVTLDGRTVEPGLPPQLPHFLARDQSLAADSCIEVRVRDVRGNRSEPSVACGELLRTFWLANAQLTSALTCDNDESFIDPDIDGPSENESADADAGSAPSDAAPPSASAASGDAAPVDGRDTERVNAAVPACALRPSAAGGSRLGALLLGAVALFAAGRRRRARSA
jgi:hypothetical protein